jgi:hypothetical protein
MAATHLVPNPFDSRTSGPPLPVPLIPIKLIPMDKWSQSNSVPLDKWSPKIWSPYFRIPTACPPGKTEYSKYHLSRGTKLVGDHLSMETNFWGTHLSMGPESGGDRMHLGPNVPQPTKSYPILTTYPSPVNNCGYFHIPTTLCSHDFLLTTYTPLFVHVVIE